MDPLSIDLRGQTVTLRDLLHYLGIADVIETAGAACHAQILQAILGQICGSAAVHRWENQPEWH